MAASHALGASAQIGAALSAMTTAPTAFVDSGEGTRSPRISGVVMDPSGAVIAGCLVRVLDSNGTVHASTRTDKEGSFSVPGLADGAYRVVIASPGFQTTEIRVTLMAEKLVPLPV